ncbi:MAG: 16S rRNA (guanine(966)-N(2))-methyltransferase RsmD [Sulfobacillus sp.]
MPGSQLEQSKGALSRLVRIIAGAARGLRLVTPSGADTRPTADRVKESLFSMLTSRLDLNGAVVADLYAGSGALGLEAASRGAARVVLIDRDASAAQTCAENCRRVARASGSVDGTPTEVITAAVEASFARLAQAGPFDLILADPPYGSGDAQSLLATAPWQVWLKDSGWLAVEHRQPLIPGVDLEQVEHRRYGTHLITFFQRRREH